ncbi:hypothetical protein RchiOBHm_Chr4g0426781 [Rosa chinensis]|uniref:Uncharacterized protein n=1 Tax=Rosa chinensis TaxID=74649 RepID=A0A2P6QZJ6_ROSCH|nr:hypothetical protein RchiOBHm_Chr4g0426781 [Rosa chinensis]
MKLLLTGVLDQLRSCSLDVSICSFNQLQPCWELCLLLSFYHVWNWNLFIWELGLFVYELVYLGNLLGFVDFFCLKLARIC